MRTRCSGFSIFQITHSDIFWEKSQRITPTGELVSPIYQRLKRYDEENGTEYVKTLKTYLDTNMNVVHTSKELFIHRATVIYRLQRIREIGHTDLTDKKELLHLGLTFTLLGQEE